MTAVSPGWPALLDRLEHRLRLIERAGLDSAAETPELGPPPRDEDVPAEPPDVAQRLRLLALVAEHDRIEARLAGRRTTLRREEQFHRAAG